MKSSIKFFKNFLLSLLLKNRRYVRLSPHHRGRIFFFDKHKKNIFKVFSREKIDSITADQVFTKHSYGLDFLKRFNELISLYQNILARGKTPLIIDCGANIGLSAHYFTQTFPQSLVIALEPEINNFLMMEKNCGHLSQVKRLHCAVGSSNGYATISNPFADNNAFRTSRTDSQDNSIAVVSIPKILSGYPDTIPFLCKIDIEGFEEDLFSKNTAWVSHFPLIIIETHDAILPKQANARNFLQVISSHNRDFILRGENIFSIANESMIEEASY